MTPKLNLNPNLGSQFFLDFQYRNPKTLTYNSNCIKFPTKQVTDWGCIPQSEGQEDKEITGLLACTHEEAFVLRKKTIAVPTF